MYNMMFSMSLAMQTGANVLQEWRQRRKKGEIRPIESLYSDMRGRKESPKFFFFFFFVFFFFVLLFSLPYSSQSAHRHQCVCVVCRCVYMKY